jgi:hypothetical protein
LNQVNEIEARKELVAWQKEMLSDPSVFNRLSKRVQTRLNRIIPEKMHETLTTIIKQMVRGVLFGAEFTTPPPLKEQPLAVREALVMEKIGFYRKTAALEGGLTGAGGILLGLADFPLLLGIKLKLLFDICALYGHQTEDYKERVYLLYIFQLAFSSQEHRRNIYRKIENWKQSSAELPADIHEFDWRSFQQEYRDYIDLAKMAQLVPIIGAPVGAIVNYRLLKKLGTTAMNAYRMRWFEDKVLIGDQAK